MDVIVELVHNTQLKGLAQPLRLRLSGSLYRWFTHDIPVLLLFLLAALAAIYPVVPEFRSRVIGWRGDNIQHAYITGWMAQALWLGQSPFVDPRLNYPDTLPLTTTEFPYLIMLTTIPFTWILGPTFSYNLIILLSSWFSGYFTYLWIRHLTGSRSGGIIAGLAFLLAPYRIAHSYGHLNLVCTYALPLFIWALDSTLQSPVPKRRNLLLLGIATFLLGSTSQYYLIIGLVTGIFYALLLLLPRIVYVLRYGWHIIASVGGGALGSALPYILTWDDGIYKSYDIVDTRIWSADPINFVLPSRLHPFWGSLIDQLRPEPLWIEKSLYISLVASLLALIALCWWGNVHRQHTRVWASIALIAAIFALGTDLHLHNQPLHQAEPFWLPAYYLTQLPFANLMRVWARFGVVTILFVALLAGVGTALIVAKLRPWRWFVLTILSILLIIDLLPGRLETSSLTQRPVDQWLAKQPGDFAVAALPANQETVNYAAMFGSLFHAKHLPAFNHPVHRSTAYNDFMQRAARFPDPGSIQALRQMGLRYLLLERGFFNGQSAPPWIAVEHALMQSAEVEIIADFDDVVVVGFR